jgi:hypothetical protein
VQNHFGNLNTVPSELHLAEKRQIERPKNARIYLGAIDDIPSLEQQKILSEWDMIILDPAQPGVTKAICAPPKGSRRAPFVLGRVDLSKMLPKHENNSAAIIAAVDRFLHTVFTSFPTRSYTSHGFTGIVLSNWEDVFAVSTLHEVSKELVRRELNVYLEAQAPNFMGNTTAIDHPSISGLVIRNGLIWPNGERRDCFDMEKMRPTTKAFMAQACTRSFLTIMWDEVDENAIISTPVLKRTYGWHRFHHTLSWISSERATMRADTPTSQVEPLSAFGWLKEAKVLKLHSAWKENDTISFHPQAEKGSYAIKEFIPTADITWDTSNDSSRSSITSSAQSVQSVHDTRWAEFHLPKKIDSMSFSETGLKLSGKGCFPLGTDVLEEDFLQVVRSQRRLRRLDLLEEIPVKTLQDYGVILEDFVESKAWSTDAIPFHIIDTVKELANTLINSVDNETATIRVYRALDTGFHSIDQKRFWGVYSPRSSSPRDMDIYMSMRAEDPIGTLVHTYLSSRSVTRRQCLEVELALAVWAGSLATNQDISKRMHQDIKQLSPSEALIFLQRVHFYEEYVSNDLIQRLRKAVESHLLDHPSKVQLAAISAVDYLSGTADENEIIDSRIKSFDQHGLAHPGRAVSLQIFATLQEVLHEILRDRKVADLELLTDALERSILRGSTDTLTDIMAVCMFTIMRRLAFEEVYIEVLDRNPFFNDQTDQGAAFAELFGLGSRCELYFDMTPSAFGKLMVTRFRGEYKDPLRQPPMFKQTGMALETAYSDPQMDIAGKIMSIKMPSYQHFTFMGVFALPALIDVLLLTTTKHGLYLSARMTIEETKYATIAFMLSLPVSGAIGTWVACGGTFYLASMAFSAMNYFVTTRLLGGFVFLLLSSLLSFVTIAGAVGPRPALIFLLYFIGLTTYLSLLASLANYSINGSSFQSGRGIILMCLPVLFLSPLITILVQGYDSEVYITVLFVFISILLLGTRYIGSKWATWLHKVNIVDDKTLRKWYLDRQTESGSESADMELEKLSEAALLKLARQELLKEILNALPGTFKFKRTKDELVRKLADSYHATLVMLDWYNRTTGLPQAIPYSSMWNVQSKVALNSLKESQRGIRFHNGFLHWRQAADEIGCTTLYFAVALLDKWIALWGGRLSIDGQNGTSELIGFVSSNNEFRFAIGFGLAYYLIGAVLLDYNAQKIIELNSKFKQDVIASESGVPEAIRELGAQRTAVYWKTLRRYLFLHAWSMAVTSGLMLLFSSSRDAAILYFAFVFSYSGLLWYQYTKTFSGPHALKPLLMGLGLGIPAGFLMRHFLPNFLFSDVCALGIATWSVAILSLWAVTIVQRTPDFPLRQTQNGYHALYNPGANPELSQEELQSIFSYVVALPENSRSQLFPDTYQGQQIVSMLQVNLEGLVPELAKRAFPEYQMLLDGTATAFADGKIVVHLVPPRSINPDRQTTRAISHTGDIVRILIACDADSLTSEQLLSQHCLLNISEILLHANAENFWGFSHDHASLVETVLRGAHGSEARISHIDECPGAFARASRRETAAFYRVSMLQNLCLGFDPDIKWDTLPEHIRKQLLERCTAEWNTKLASTKFYVERDLKGLDYDTYLARCDYGAYVSAQYYRDTVKRSHMAVTTFTENTAQKEDLPKLLPHRTRAPWSTLPRQGAGYVWHKIGKIAKFFAVAFVADPEYQRELNCAMAKYPRFLSALIKLGFNGMWVLSKAIQSLFLPFFLFHSRKDLVQLWKRIQGREVKFTRKNISIRTLDGNFTAFIHGGENGQIKLYQYEGEHSSEPQTKDKLKYINTYSASMSLMVREEFAKGEVVSAAEYDYYDQADPAQRRLSRPRTLQQAPITRRGVAGRDEFQIISYDAKGLVESGSYIKDGNLVRFHYNYRKSGKLEGELLRAEFVLPHMSCSVSWCTPPPRNSDKLDKWTSYSEVTEAIFVVGQDVWESKWTYDHKYHPTIATTLNGESVDTPPLIKYDFLDILTKPRSISFLDDNPLYGFTNINPNTISRLLGLHKRRYPFLTSESRYWLWKAWKDSSDYDGVVIRWLDERLLRREKSLRPYWVRRDWGELVAAEKYLLQNLDKILAKVDLDKTISSWTPLAIKMNDLLTFGPGGSASGRTRSKLTSQSSDDDASLHVIAVDTGTWPNEGGGVSACRRDVINNLKTIKWHMVVESANDFGIPKHQIERNVHSLKVIPIWGLDLMTPTHGLFENRLDSEISHSARHTDKEDIRDNFVPILAVLVHGARTLSFDKADLKQLTRALIRLNAYFGDGTQHWRVVWNSKVVKNAWRRLWLSKLSDKVRAPSEWFDAEQPTLGQLDEGLELWSRYLFIFSIPVPEKMPDVFQASHHSVSASYGIVCKIKRGCTFQIWDHAISWRETNLWLSSGQCSLAPFVRNSLLGLLRMTSVLTLHHADTLLPCADFFNPGWEVEIGTCEGTIEHRNIFKRKIDPIVNGITDMERFKPVVEIKTKTPTVTMLSHVWFAKDIKTAILSADIIVNEWGFTDYQLEIYGAVHKSPAYSSSCQELITANALSKNVVLKGEIDAMVALERTVSYPIRSSLLHF